MVKVNEVDDAMSIALQHAARRDSGKLVPTPLGLSVNDDKLLQMLERRKLIKRVKVRTTEPYHKKIKGFGHANYKVTKQGLAAIAWD